MGCMCERRVREMCITGRDKPLLEKLPETEPVISLPKFRHADSVLLSVLCHQKITVRGGIADTGRVQRNSQGISGLFFLFRF